MKKISVNNIIEFKHRAEKNQKAFLNILEKKAEVKTEGGGNYWIRSLSAMSNGIKLNSHEPIKEKIAEILELLVPGLTGQTKDMYQRNLNILYNYEGFDFSNWLPDEFIILSKSNKSTMIFINTIPVQITPSQIFSFEENGRKFVGAVWFVAKLGGYRKEELGMFAEALFVFLSNNFQDNFQISPKKCIVVDVLEKVEVNYQNLITNEVPSVLESTLDQIKQKL